MSYDDYLRKSYKANGQGFWHVIGLITSPALVMVNPITGDKQTVVIDCLNHQQMQEMSTQDAFDVLWADNRKLKDE